MSSAILITYDDNESIEEARGLCDTAGYKVIHVIKQRFLNRPKFGISGHTLEKLEEMTDNLRPDVIIFDEILKPSQNYNLASTLHKTILDREMLILEIFERRASSAESKLQVKLAQLRYEMARAKEKVRLSSMGEQPGFMGIGKFEVDVYYNDIKHRMQSIRAKLLRAGRQRELHRQGRKRAGFKTVSLAGYTSAGKTTLFNKITGENKAESTELFTTLSTTTRRMTIQKELFLISDTVGFISKLPAYMIDAFKSTLEELCYADIVIIVIDISNPIHELQKKFSSCIKTLADLGIEPDKMVYALNKIDQIDDDEIEQKIKALDLIENKKWIKVSAKNNTNITKLKLLVHDIMQEQDKVEAIGIGNRSS